MGRKDNEWEYPTKTEGDRRGPFCTGGRGILNTARTIPQALDKKLGAQAGEQAGRRAGQNRSKPMR